MHHLRRAWDWTVVHLVPGWLYRATELAWGLLDDTPYKPPPEPGDQVLYHGDGPFTVLSVDGDDDITITAEGDHPPRAVSWAHCCEPAPTS